MPAPNTPSRVVVKVPSLVVPPNVEMISAGVEMSYKQASEAFYVRPSAENYNRLHSNALALQFWRGLMSERRQEIAARLWEMPIGLWTNTLVAAQKKHFEGVAE